MTVKNNVARLHPKSNRKTPQALKYSYQAKDGKDGNKFKFAIPGVGDYAHPQYRPIESRQIGRAHGLKLDPMSQHTPKAKISGLTRLKLSNVINSNEPNSPISLLSPLGPQHSTL